MIVASLPPRPLRSMRTTARAGPLGAAGAAADGVGPAGSESRSPARPANGESGFLVVTRSIVVDRLGGGVARDDFVASRWRGCGRLAADVEGPRVRAGA